MASLFHVVLYQPIFNIFIWLYDIVPSHDVGVVILIITIIIRLVLYPLTTSSIKAQQSMQELQPKLEAIKKEHATDKQKQAEATMALYKTHKINPFASCLPLLIQLPILLALFWVLRDGLASTNLAQNLYPFVKNPGTIKAMTLGLVDLGAPSIALAILAGAAQFLQAKTLSRTPAPKSAGVGGKDENMAAMMNKQMLYFMPLMTVLIGIRFPAGLTLYWFLSTALMVVQQLIVAKKPTNGPSSTGATTAGAIEGTIVK